MLLLLYPIRRSRQSNTVLCCRQFWLKSRQQNAKALLITVSPGCEFLRLAASPMRQAKGTCHIDRPLCPFMPVTFQMLPAVLSDAVPLVVSRQLLSNFAQEVSSLPPELHKEVAK